MHMRNAAAATSSSIEDSLSPGVHDFLRRRMPYTVLPAPTPSDATSTVNEIIFPGSPTQEALTVINACLHDCYDVARAEWIFDQLRNSREGGAVLEARVFNLFLETYFVMAVERDTVDFRDVWMERAWKLYDSMENDWEFATPNAGTYAIMLKTWLKYVSTSLLLSALLDLPVLFCTIQEEHGEIYSDNRD